MGMLWGSEIYTVRFLAMFSLEVGGLRKLRSVPAEMAYMC